MSKRNMGENVKELRLTDKQVEAAIKRAEANQKNWTRWPDKPKETTMADKTDIGKTIRARREAAGLTQSALARKLECAEAMVSRWETGRVVPSMKYAEKLSAALGGVAGDYLVK